MQIYCNDLYPARHVCSSNAFASSLVDLGRKGDDAEENITVCILYYSARSDIIHTSIQPVFDSN